MKRTHIQRTMIVGLVAALFLAAIVSSASMLHAQVGPSGGSGSNQGDGGDIIGTIDGNGNRTGNTGNGDGSGNGGESSGACGTESEYPLCSKDKGQHLCPDGTTVATDPDYAHHNCTDGDKGGRCYKCVAASSSSSSATCTDTDGGVNVFANGTVKADGFFPITDECRTNSLHQPVVIAEGFCNAGSYDAKLLTCPNGLNCSDGKCAAVSGWTGPLTCFDDDGNDQRSTGYTFVMDRSGKKVQEGSDDCKDTFLVNEWVCSADGQSMKTVVHHCDSGACDNGRCSAP